MSKNSVPFLEQTQAKFHKQQNFLFRLLFETSFILTLGFVATLVLQTLWMLEKIGSSFSYSAKPHVFRQAILGCFATSLGCFVLYFVCFYLFAVFHRLSWKLVRKSFIILLVTALFNLTITSFSLIKVNFPAFFAEVGPEKMFLYFFPPLVISTFVGISVSTTFIFQMRHVQLKNAKLAAEQTLLSKSE